MTTPFLSCSPGLTDRSREEPCWATAIANTESSATYPHRWGLAAPRRMNNSNPSPSPSPSCHDTPVRVPIAVAPNPPSVPPKSFRLAPSTPNSMGHDHDSPNRPQCHPRGSSLSSLGSLPWQLTCSIFSQGGRGEGGGPFGTNNCHLSSTSVAPLSKKRCTPELEFRPLSPPSFFNKRDRAKLNATTARDLLARDAA